MLKMLSFIICEVPQKISTIFRPFLAIFTLFHLKNWLYLKKPQLSNLGETRFWLLLVNNSLCSIPLSCARSEIKETPGDRCVVTFASATQFHINSPLGHTCLGYCFNRFLYVKPVLLSTRRRPQLWLFLRLWVRNFVWSSTSRPPLALTVELGPHGTTAGQFGNTLWRPVIGCTASVPLKIPTKCMAAATQRTSVFQLKPIWSCMNSQDCKTKVWIKIFLMNTILAGVDPVSCLTTRSTSSELIVRAAGLRYLQPAQSQTSPSESQGQSSCTSVATATTNPTSPTLTRSCSARGTCLSTPLLSSLAYVGLSKMSNSFQKEFSSSNDLWRGPRQRRQLCCGGVHLG